MVGKGSAWVLAFVLGLVGILVSTGVFFGIMLATGRIYGIVAILTGAIAGGIAAYGYKIGGGTFKTEMDVSKLVWFVTGVGLIAVLAGFVLGPYGYFLLNAGFIDFGTFWRLFTALGGIEPIDVLFMLIGAYGGRWAGKNVAYSIALGQAQEQVMEKVKKEGVKEVDEKFK